MKILFITRFDFVKDKKDGGVLGSARNHGMLCDLYGEENVILYILSPYRNTSTERIQYFKSDKNLLITYLHYAMLKDRISKKVEKEILQCILNEKPDIIFYDGSTFGQIIKNACVRKIKSIVFFHNIERQYTWEQVKKYSKLCIFRYLATRINEQKMAKLGNKLICLNLRDAGLLSKFYGRKPDMILPITFKDTYEALKSKELLSEIDLLYVGSYYAHNYKGLIWFIKYVMPYINRHLTVVGKDMHRLSDKIKIPENVHIIGTVEDISLYYMSANAIVMPIFMGGGMKVKTAEAMMYGKVIFASMEALEGYTYERAEHIFLCNSAEEFIQNINQYNFDQSARLNDDVRQIFLEKYCTDHYIRVIKDLVDSL